MTRTRRALAIIATALLISGAGVANAESAEAFPFSARSYNNWQWCKQGSWAYPKIEGSCWPYLLGRLR